MKLVVPSGRKQAGRRENSLICILLASFVERAGLQRDFGSRVSKNNQTEAGFSSLERVVVLVSSGLIPSEEVFFVLCFLK